MSEDGFEGPPPFDAKFVQQYIGQYVLIGITYFDEKGAAVRQEQIHGVIASVTSRGIQVELKGAHEGEFKGFPPDIRSLKIAPPGEYTLRATKEVITNPDLLWTWDVFPSAKTD